MTDDFPASTVLGYPRIGPDRELKHALEGYWDGRLDRAELDRVGRVLRADTWRRLAQLGLDGLPSNTFSEYDQVLDTAVLVDAVPERFRECADPYFAMARGGDGVAPLRMTKWFDTNYHYLVPEIGPKTRFRLVADKPLGEVREARELGYETRPVVVGPVTFLRLAQAAPGSPGGYAPIDRLDDLLDVYVRLLSALADAGVGWVQLDEPVLVTDGGSPAVRHAYRRLAGHARRPRLLVASYFGDIADALPALAVTAVDAVALDLTHGVPANVDLLQGKTVVGGVVSGREVWRTDLDSARALLAGANAASVSTSCSLLHVPYSLRGEDVLPGRLAFAEEKVAEVVELARLGPKPGPVAVVPAMGAPSGAHDLRVDLLERRAREDGQAHGATAAGEDGAGGVPAERSAYEVRAAAQRDLGLPMLPVTTIGSFPQTGALRAARREVAAGARSEAEYEELVRAEIRRVVEVQERLGIDVLVHGEPERNDMVQYFAEHLDGFAVTRNGWVQSYGSRCTRPPILHGDVRRSAPITVRWARYAQSLTEKPVKGMLTGPVTIVAWSFVRDDLPLRDVTMQVADAVRAEVRDLEAAGIRVIQVDEPALRELLPLRREDQAGYLEWAVAAYRRATGGAGDATQIHTHLCYSNADEVLAAIDGLDADVTSIESARSGTAVQGFGRGLGPGVYDIHSPRIPDVAEVTVRLRSALRHVPAERLWVNPDCGLKTRTYEQVEAALTNVVAAARKVRSVL
ncbi:5-methyltetrahydropteroyltriglutamate--homocysteine S-methyltransferase [Dactylosporangium sp. AC04546]|uniref:5-methyltetrahydropteroyltriglutamate-- homocysteine S-methyltransferase n=1 Tax=Dactylosporangium sp. AC04546 TaxID=2862460 RepID=UPI001EE0E73F|nr:5-methyltetrahydropteroyltriglutamate--homocysteine S-methyltransferase [Dactylosporangium sp. AC04546]WVK85653.1 5-methyltetrahydropteroyltriglutamate--homocysteine S-methyltransferase [Dactylosporangium sp. AC04546]